MAMSDSLPGLLTVGDLDVTVEVSGRRRSVRLTVERDASVRAVVPPQVDRDTLVRIITSRRRWLYGRLAERRALGEPRPEREYVSGEGFPYLGRSYRLLLVDEGPVRLVRGRLELARGDTSDTEDAARQLVRWYRKVGEPWLRRRIGPWAERVGVSVTGLRVMPLGYRWGSCSADGQINIHWATMQLPSDLIDYVLLHELAHLRRRDHGPEFWRIVSLAMPGYEARRERLKRVGVDLWLPEDVAP
ncbi:M48 family metallopeptidase [Streptosporangium amethystogenes]|uniref:M48 family metallopeptidase n=1 Tax=Streptosporangium amethystogenes TaxID=2002 RepID=UPI003792EEE9